MTTGNSRMIAGKILFNGALRQSNSLQVTRFRFSFSKTSEKSAQESVRREDGWEGSCISPSLSEEKDISSLDLRLIGEGEKVRGRTNRRNNSSNIGTHAQRRFTEKVGHEVLEGKLPGTAEDCGRSLLPN